MDAKVTVQAGSSDSEGADLPLLRKKDRPETVVNVRRRVWSSLRWLGAALCLAMMIASWVTMAEKLQGIGRHYNKPFFQSYFIRSFYSILYIAWKFWIIVPGGWSCNKVGEGALSTISFKVLAISSGILALIGYLSAAFWYVSLTQTSISANTAIYQSASIAVFIISVPLLREKVSLLKIISVILTVGGVAVVSVFTSDVGHHNTNTSNSSSSPSTDDSAPIIRSTPLGYVYVAVSMVLYAIMETSYKKFCTKPHDPAAVQNSVRVLGYMGVHTALWMWPFILIFHYTNIEPFELPDLPTFELLVVNIFLDLIFNAALFVCIALSSPLFTTVGSVLAIPGSVLVDWMINHYVLPWQAFVGVAILLGGFIILIFCEYWEESHTHDHTSLHCRNSQAMLGPSAPASINISQENEKKGLINTLKRRQKKGILYYII